MTAEEAIAGAAERHEFKAYAHEKAGSLDVVRFVCHGAGCVSTTYPDEPAARRAHTRHQERLTARRRKL